MNKRTAVVAKLKADLKQADERIKELVDFIGGLEQELYSQRAKNSELSMLLTGDAPYHTRQVNGTYVIERADPYQVIAERIPSLFDAKSLVRLLNSRSGFTNTKLIDLIAELRRVSMFGEFENEDFPKISALLLEQKKRKDESILEICRRYGAESKIQAIRDIRQRWSAGLKLAKGMTDIAFHIINSEKEEQRLAFEKSQEIEGSWTTATE